MTKDRVFAFARKLQSMIKQARELEASLDDGEAYKTMLADVEPAKALEISKKLADGRKRLEHFVTTIAKEAKRDSVAAAEELLGDLTVALEQAEKEYEAWRGAKAQFELEIRAQEVSHEIRQAAEAKLTQLKKRYETAVDIASDLVPSPGVVQL